MAASKQRAEKFLMQELKALSTGDRDDGFSAGLNGDDLFNWSVCIMGPEGSLYEGGIFQASLQFPHSYPDNPPVMRFITPIFHPNIWPDGKVYEGQWEKNKMHNYGVLIWRDGKRYEG